MTTFEFIIIALLLVCIFLTLRKLVKLVYAIGCMVKMVLTNTILVGAMEHDEQCDVKHHEHAHE